MRAATFIVAALVVGGSLLALAPGVEARQACTYGTGDPCDEYAACVWNKLEGRWECVGYIDPCWFRCW